MVFFSTYATVKNGDFIGNSKVTLRFINSFLGTAERKLTFTSDIGIGMYGISAGYQISKNSPAGEIIKSERLFSSSDYFSVNEGEYLTIVNATISKVN